MRHPPSSILNSLVRRGRLRIRLSAGIFSGRPAPFFQLLDRGGQRFLRRGDVGEPRFFPFERDVPFVADAAQAGGGNLPPPLPPPPPGKRPPPRGQHCGPPP